MYLTHSNQADHVELPPDTIVGCFHVYLTIWWYHLMLFNNLQSFPWFLIFYCFYRTFYNVGHIPNTYTTISDSVIFPLFSILIIIPMFWLVDSCIQPINSEHHGYFWLYLYLYLYPWKPIPSGTGMGILADSCFWTLGIPVPVPVAGNPQVCPN